METLYKLLKEDGDALLQENDGLILLDSMKLVDVNDQITSSEEITIENPLTGISVSETTTISDNFEKQNIMFLNSVEDITISEDLTLTTDMGAPDDENDVVVIEEEATVFLPDLGGIDVFDEMTVEDLFGQNVTIRLDYANISENITVEMPLGNISVEDTVTISENFGGTPSMNIRVEEIMIMIEDIAFFHPLVPLSLLDDDITISDIITMGQQGTINVNVLDIITVSENRTSQDYLNDISVFDLATVTDVINGGYAPFPITVSDSITIDENINVELFLLVNTASNLAIFDNFDKEAIHHAFTSDQITTTETITFESFRMSPGAKRVGKLGASL